MDEGQNEAAQALGMTRRQTMRRIVLPAGDARDHPADRQRDDLDAEDHLAGRVIAYAELLYAAQIIYSRNFQQIPLLIVASFWYMLLTSVLTIGQYYLEQRLLPRLSSRSCRRRRCSACARPDGCQLRATGLA